MILAKRAKAASKNPSIVVLMEATVPPNDATEDASANDGYVFQCQDANAAPTPVIVGAIKGFTATPCY